MFSSLEEAEAFCRVREVVVPSVPVTTAFEEDVVTERICMSATIEDCISAIGTIGVFRRCVGHNEDAKSYATAGIEVYPIIIQTFEVDESDIYVPTKEDVPDVDMTGEVWLLRPMRPVECKLVWLDMFSIDVDSADFCHCIGVRFYENFPVGHTHPWVTHSGHVLDSSEDEGSYSSLALWWGVTV